MTKIENCGILLVIFKGGYLMRKNEKSYPWEVQDRGNTVLVVILVALLAFMVAGICFINAPEVTGKNNNVEEVEVSKILPVLNEAENDAVVEEEKENIVKVEDKEVDIKLPESNIEFTNMLPIMGEQGLTAINNQKEQEEVIEEVKPTGPNFEEDYGKFSTIAEAVEANEFYSMENMTKGLEEDINVLSQMLYGECGAHMNFYEQSMAVWTVYNRLDMGRFGADVQSIVKAPNQFHGYRASNPVDERCYFVAQTVTWFHMLEQKLGISEGRTLPSQYVFFWGDGKHNHFRDYDKNTFAMDSANPYEYITMDTEN